MTITQLLKRATNLLHMQNPPLAHTVYVYIKKLDTSNVTLKEGYRIVTLLFSNFIRVILKVIYLIVTLR